MKANSWQHTTSLCSLYRKKNFVEKVVYSSRDLVWSQMLTEMLEASVKHRDNFGSESLLKSGLFWGRFNDLFAFLKLVF